MGQIGECDPLRPVGIGDLDSAFTNNGLITIRAKDRYNTFSELLNLVGDLDNGKNDTLQQMGYHMCSSYGIDETTRANHVDPLVQLFTKCFYHPVVFG